MPKFRLKMPVDAEQYNGPVAYEGPREGLPQNPVGTYWSANAARTCYNLRCPGEVPVELGDWLVTDSTGLTTPRSDASFRDLYEPVDLHAEPTPPVDMRFALGAGCVTPDEPKPS